MIHHHHKLLLLSIILAALVVPLPAEEITVTASRDNTLYQDDTGSVSNGAGPHFYVGRVGNNGEGLIRRALLSFDLSSIPPGSTVESVSLVLTVNQVPDGTSRSISVHQLLQNWGEGASNAGEPGGQGTAAATGDATWLHTQFPDQFWVNPGGDFVSQPALAVAEVGAEGSYTWGSTAALVANVQTWVDNPAFNRGWLLRGVEDTLGTAKRFSSRENSESTSRPQLTVVYTPARPPLIQFTTETFVTPESEGRATIRVSRLGGDTGEVTIDYATADGTATEGADYLAASGTLVFGDGVLGEKTFQVQLLDNDVYQGDRTVLLSLSGATGGAVIGDPGSGVLVIQDEEDLDEELYLAQFGNGDGFFSQIFLQNLSASLPSYARIMVRTNDGEPFQVSLNDQPLQEGQLDRALDPSGLLVLQSDAEGTPEAGSVLVRSDQPLAGVIIFGGDFGLAGVAGQRIPGREFRGPVEVDSESNTNTGVAIQNLQDGLVMVDLELVDSGGMPHATGQIELVSQGHEALFATQIQWDPTPDFSSFEGTIRATASGPIAAVMIQTRPGQFATLPTVTLGELSVEPARDNTLFEDLEGRFSNGRGEALFVGKTGPNTGELRRALFGFDVSRIPPGSVIEEVGLTLTVTRSRDVADKNLTLHRVLTDWGEGASNADVQPAGSGDGGGTAALPGDATWIHSFFDTQQWANAGGDFDPTASAGRMVGGPGVYQWSSTPGLLDDVQGWVDEPSSNFGWLLLGDETTQLTARRFASRENPTVENRPRLTVRFSPPDTGKLYFAQFGNGEGFFSQITLLNLDDTQEALAELAIRTDDGGPFEVDLNGEPLVNGELDVMIPPSGSKVLQTDAQGMPRAGSVAVSSDRPVAGVIVFGGDFGLAGVGGSYESTQAFLGPVEVDTVQKIDTGVAVQNLETSVTTVSLDLVNAQGDLLASAQLVLQPLGHQSIFATQIKWDEVVDFATLQGSIRATSDGRVAAIMIQTRPGQFATLPVTFQ